jgi:hypothetical protein
MRDLLGLAAAAVTFIAAIEWLSAGCEARWLGREASYRLLTGCMVEVNYLRVPEGSIRVQPDRLHPNLVR